MVDLAVPFFANTEDGWHCFQASLRIVLKFYLPHEDFDWTELDSITAHTSNYTWESAGVRYCIERGFQVRWVEAFDHVRFGEEGYSYLLEFFGPEVAEDQRRNSDLQQEMRLVAELARFGVFERRVPSRGDLLGLIGSGWLSICNINACALNGQPGYVGHFVVVKGGGAKEVRLHDPGLPPQIDRAVSWEVFERAWAYPDDRAKNILALHLPGSHSLPSKASACGPFDV
jgi:hypothetical protein